MNLVDVYCNSRVQQLLKYKLVSERCAANNNIDRSLHRKSSS